MDRRQFLRCSAFCGLSAGLGKFFPRGQTPSASVKDRPLLGLGTDGGGNLPSFIEGYQDICDLPKLIRAMQEVRLTNDEIAAYVGGNVYRVPKACIG